MGGRRLTAILAADIAGYSALMGSNDVDTVSDLKGHQSAVLPLIAGYSGRVIDTAGDGILAEFQSVYNAVKCAIAIQEVMQERNASAIPARRMQFRIGINQGDVLFDDERIFGDGINVAARLEGLCEPGGICISGKVYEEIKGRFEIQYEDIGEQSLKNIAVPVQTYRISAPGSVVTAGKRSARPQQQLPGPAMLAAGLTLGAILAAGGAWWAFGNRGSVDLARGTSDGKAATGDQRKNAASVGGVVLPTTRPEAPRDQPGPGENRASIDSPVTEKKPSSDGLGQSSGASVFDGTWEVVSTGGTYCQVKSNKWFFSVENGILRAARRERGRVAADGSFRILLPALVDSAVLVVHQGKLSGDTGDAAYFAGECVGKSQIVRTKKKSSVP